MQAETKKTALTGPERGRLFRQRSKAGGVPTDAQLDRTIRKVLVDNVAAADMTPAKVLTEARARLLKQGFSWQGVNRALAKCGSGQ